MPGEYDYVIEHLPIQRAALLDDWDSVSKIFEQEPDLMTKQITYWWETPLILAVKTNRSNNFVKKLVQAIVSSGSPEKLFVTSYHANNPLHYAAKVGNTFAAKLLVEQDAEMTHIPNTYGDTPLNLAAWHGNKHTLEYLLTVTPIREYYDPYAGVSGGNLITLIIKAGFVDVAFQVVDMHPDIVLEENKHAQTALVILATKPEFFPSESLLGFWERRIYSLIPVTSRKETTRVNISFTSSILNKLSAALWSCLPFMAPAAIKKIQDIKIKHIQSQLLVNRICEIFIQKGDHTEALKTFVSSLTVGVEHGTYEVIKECISTYPDIISYDEGRGLLFFAAIKQRQERVYNLVCQLSGNQTFAADNSLHMHDDGDDGNNALHIAARLAPTHRLNAVTGAPLQMQRELLWFKEVEKNIEPSYREAKNRDGKTPRMLFSEEHKDLLKNAQEWMKDTASSCTVVAALIVTVAFAAAFTVPGGNQDNGKPLFLDKGTFMIFIVADAVALFSSCTSVLMFLGILTSRFAEDDFLYALPKRLTVGLLTLFLSLAATLIAFSVALALVLQEKVTWIAAPLVIATSIPVCLFGLLQFPLLVELISSTYGRSLFN